MHDNKLININLSLGILLLCFWCQSGIVHAEMATLKAIQARTIAGNRAQIRLEFTGTAPSPHYFTMDEPSKIVIDLPKTMNTLAEKDKHQKYAIGVMKATQFIETVDKVRLIIDVINLVPYEVDKYRNTITITMDNDVNLKQSTASSDKTIQAVDFRRGANGEGQLVLTLSDDAVPIDIKEENSDIVMEFRGANILPSLLRRYDLTDFGTPIKQVKVSKKNQNVVFNIKATLPFEKIAYQVGNKFTLEARMPAHSDLDDINIDADLFTGEKISLNFQDIEIRAVLQLIADFTGLNLVTSDSVQGAVTLKLDDVPWDQALDYIMQAKGLSKRESDGVTLIAPNEEITAREQLELEALQQSTSLAPLHSEIIQVNYARAEDLVDTLLDADNSLLSLRGQVSFDDRTNTILIKETADQLLVIKKLLTMLDVPVRQVLVEAQIVEVSDNFQDAFGVRFTGNATPKIGGYQLGLAPTFDKARSIADDPSTKSTDTTNYIFDGEESTALGKVGLALARLPGGTLLDLELQASELEDKTLVLGRPRLLILDQQTASIETGQDLPFPSSDGGTTSVTFKKAVLRLEVTPSITPNNQVSMDLLLAKDTPGTDKGSGSAGINTTNVESTVLVDNGETIVLGGIFTLDVQNNVARLPLLSRLPFIGRIFRSNDGRNNRREILIFVTPRIVSQITQPG